MKFCLLTIVAALLWPIAGYSQTIPKWSTAEITLTAASNYSNPYTQGNVTATFSGPGASKVVKGFWDGGSTWKIRFTPTAEGSWSYTTSSSDSGLNNKSGTITATSPGGNRGFVRRNVSNPYTFSWDNGDHYFMWGQTYYDVIRTVAASSSWKAGVDNSQAHGINKVRLHVFAAGEMGLSQGGNNPYPQIFPFVGTGSDHDQLNIPYWKKLDEYVNYLAARGMVADLILFHPYASVLTGQGKTHGTQAQDERFTRYALARYAAYPNVIWCLSNEYEGSMSYWDSIGNIVRNEDPWMSQGPALRPLSIHQHTKETFDFFGSAWPTHAIIQFKGGAINVNGAIVANLGRNMPVVDDEYGYMGRGLSTDQIRKNIWQIAAAGGYGSVGDGRAFGDTEPQGTGEWHDAPEYDDVKRLVDFFTTKGAEFWKMSSQNSLTSSIEVYVLAEAGRQYLIYAASWSGAGNFSVNLPAGNYTAVRYNPRTGAETALADVSGGGSRSFTVPDKNDWVLYLRSGSATPPPPPPPTDTTAPTVSITAPAGA